MKPVRVPERGDPLVRALFRLMNATGCGPTELARRSGIGRPAIRSWQTGAKTPSVSNLAACFQALGYELELRAVRPLRGADQPAEHDEAEDDAGRHGIAA